MNRTIWIAMGVALFGCDYPDFTYTCRVLHPEDCATGERCTIRDDVTGTTHCVAVATSPLPLYGACTTDSMCPAQSWCDASTSLCKPVCETDDQCNGGRCQPARVNRIDKIPGLNVCVANCEPKTAVPCDATGTTCAYDVISAMLDCFATGGKAENAACGQANECMAGYVCARGTCQRWCTQNLDCPSEQECCPFDSFTPTHEHQTYGFCY